MFVLGISDIVWDCLKLFLIEDDLIAIFVIEIIRILIASLLKDWLY